MVNVSKAIGWGRVIAPLIGVGLVVGLAFGLLGAVVGLPSALITAVVGLTCGLAAPLLILRMRPTH